MMNYADRRVIPRLGALRQDTQMAAPSEDGKSSDQVFLLILITVICLHAGHIFD